MKPDSTVSTQTFSSVAENVASAALSSSLARCASPRVQAKIEAIGLVEVGVGLIPGGGGTKEFTKRVSDSIEEGDIELNALQNALMNIATAKVATSAQEAREMGILRSFDQVSMKYVITT